MVTEAERRIHGKAAQCLVVSTPGQRALYVSPESDLGDWWRALTSLKPPANSTELRRNTIGDRPVASVELDEGAQEESDENAGNSDAAAIPLVVDQFTASWPPEEGRLFAFEVAARAVAAQMAVLTAADSTSPAVRRAIASCAKAVASISAAVAAPGGSGAGGDAAAAAAGGSGGGGGDTGGGGGEGRTDADTAEQGRDVAAAVLTLQGVNWEGRVLTALMRIDAQAAEFESQMAHVREHGVLPDDVRRIAVEQLLDAIGAIVVVVQGLLLQAEQEVARRGYVTVMAQTSCTKNDGHSVYICIAVSIA